MEKIITVILRFVVLIFSINLGFKAYSWIYETDGVGCGLILTLGKCIFWNIMCFMHVIVLWSQYSQYS